MSSANTPTIGPLDPRDATPLPLEPGDVVAARYEVLRLLGSGGSAYVYAVRDRRIGDEIALKLLRGDVDVARSRREAEFARGSSSARLVRAFDLVEADGLVFLTMELVPGGSLRDRLRREPLPIDEVIRLAGEILEALADLHALDIVHRDLKPGNLLLTAGGHVKLSDFGIARRWTDDDSRLTVTGATLGTIDYLSPEQATGEEVDPRSDLYSFGVLLYEMLTGRLPFEATSKVAAIGMRLQRRPGDVRTLRPETPRWLAAIVARLLQTKREDRYPSAEAVLRDLRRRRVRVARPRMGVMALLVVLVIAGAVWWGTRPPAMEPIADGDWGLRLEVDGRGVWRRTDTHPSHAVVVQRGEVQEIAAILAPSREQVKNPVFGRTLVFLDARTGRPLARRSLESAARVFTEHSDRFHVTKMLATDVNHDGYSEVLVNYEHDYYPSFVSMYDLRSDTSQIVFVASGRHSIEDVVDLDEDGIDDLLMVGTANLHGWHVGVAGVRVLPGQVHAGAAYTPDRWQPARGRPLLWYALCRPGAAQLSGVVADSKTKRIRVRYAWDAVELTFDGFLAVSQSSLSVDARQAARDAAYEHLRQAARFTPAAAAEAEIARGQAERAGDPLLAEWSERVKGAALIRAGRFDEGVAVFHALFENAEAAASDIAFDAANAFHLAGKLPQAVAWYRRSLGEKAHPSIGRLKPEVLQGAVLAWGELGRWDGAEQEIDRYVSSYPNGEAEVVSHRHYVAWRSRGVSSARYDPRHPNDADRYWALEGELSRGAGTRTMLAAIEHEQQVASETRRLIPFLHAEVLRRDGQLDEAWRIALEAYPKLYAKRSTYTLDRAHLKLAEERIAAIAREKGIDWHPPRMAP